MSNVGGMHRTQYRQVLQEERYKLSDFYIIFQFSIVSISSFWGK